MRGAGFTPDRGRDQIPVAIFARPPRPGEAKTRLIPALGAARAADLAAAMFADTHAAIADLPWALPVVATPDPAWPWPGEVWDHGGGDLGARVERILRRGLEISPFTIAIGADSPGMPRDRLESLYAALLSGAGAAIVPAEDGGFVAIGVSRRFAEEPDGLLADLPWSRPDTRAAIVARLESRGLPVSLGAPWWDVDEPADLERLRTFLAEPAAAPATAALRAVEPRRA